MSSSDATLIEGIDYYIESGRWIFTSLYHQKRGYCCENICRHCPYGNSPADRERSQTEGSSTPDQNTH